MLSQILQYLLLTYYEYSQAACWHTDKYSIYCNALLGNTSLDQWIKFEFFSSPVSTPTPTPTPAPTPSPPPTPAPAADPTPTPTHANTPTSRQTS